VNNFYEKGIYKTENNFGSAIFSERSSVFRAFVAVRKHLGTGRPRVEILPFRPI